MDIEHINHEKAKMTRVLAMLLSTLVVIGTALLGRGMLHITSSLTSDIPDAVTVMQIELQRDPGTFLSHVDALPKRPGSDEYGFLYEKNNEKYFVRVARKNGKWDFASEPELLHGKQEPASLITLPETQDE